MGITAQRKLNRNQLQWHTVNKALTEFLASTMGPVRGALQYANIRYLILSGTETELLLQMLGLDTQAKVTRIKAEDFYGPVQQGP